MIREKSFRGKQYEREQIREDDDRSSSIIWSKRYTIRNYEWIDEATRGSPGHSGCGGVFLTWRGFVKGCFLIYLGVKFIFESEMMGLILALKLAARFNWTDLWVESEYEFVVYLLKSRSS